MFARLVQFPGGWAQPTHLSPAESRVAGPSICLCEKDVLRKPCLGLLEWLKW
jgi:hypothetical protein